MPIPIAHLFEEEVAVHRMPDTDDVQEMSKGWPNIDISFKDCPEIYPPQVGTEEHDEDMSSVQRYVLNPANTEKFLESAEKKYVDFFHDYVVENNLDFDFKKMRELNNQLSCYILNLKFKFNRPRPKKTMERQHSFFPYEKIEDSQSPSYPSGHTAHAYFTANIMGSVFPEHAERLNNLASLIAQSRLDLGKHYPSDVMLGRYIGELASKNIQNVADLGAKINENVYPDQKEYDSHNERYSREIFRSAGNRHNMQKYGTSYIDEFCEFIVRSNQIERYKVPVDETYDAVKLFLKGLPVSYCTENPYIKSHLASLDKSASLHPIDSISKIQAVHEALGSEVMERGDPGVIRPFVHYARSSGYRFADPVDIPYDLDALCADESIDPVEKHIRYECIHPFSDGNGRSGRIMLASDLDFDFAKINDVIGHNYIDMIINYQNGDY